jgi:hypothetical protein
MARWVCHPLDWECQVRLLRQDLVDSGWMASFPRLPGLGFASRPRWRVLTPGRVGRAVSRLRI